VFLVSLEALDAILYYKRVERLLIIGSTQKDRGSKRV